jgi:DNA processing protein
LEAKIERVLCRLFTGVDRTAGCGWRRRALIALNSCESLPREAICRLGQDLDRWASPGGAPSPAALDLPHRYLPTARQLLSDADALAGRESRRAAALGARLLTVLDSDYPCPLLDLALPPPVLYCLGEIPSRPATAIVGSRAADAYGREAATLFARELASAGLTIVSGLARGVDTAAHRGALAAAGGLTVGVLGCGLDVRYPPGTDQLRREISARGAVVTEFPFGTTPQAWNFPIRNRLIAGLAGGTLVVQGKARSGSLITARLALELGRDVYAVPGRIFDSRSVGPNRLIRDGALAAQSPRDILESLPLADRDRLPAGPEPSGEATTNTVAGLAGDAARLLAKMTPGEPLPPDKLAAASKLGVDRLLALLLELELAGHVRREPGPAWCRRA